MSLVIGSPLDQYVTSAFEISPALYKAVAIDGGFASESGASGNRFSPEKPSKTVLVVPMKMLKLSTQVEFELRHTVSVTK